jgi:Zn-finger nucleic acid-binding protein
MNNIVPLNCPACLTKTETLSIKSHYEIPIRIEQCQKCGGIWFNDLDFHKVKIGEASIIENLNRNKLQKFSVVKNTNLLCPKDNSILIQFKDINFPKEIIIEKCPKCNGFWFNHGEFSSYQNDIKKKGEQAKQKENEKILPKTPFEIQMEKFLESTSSSKNHETIMNLANFLSSPIDRMTLRAIDDNPNHQIKNKTINVFIGFLRLLLRLLIR